MKYFIWFIILIDIVSAKSSDGIAHYTHLGGILAGAIFMFIFCNGRRKFRVYKAAHKASSDESQESSGTEPLEGEVFYVDEQKRMDEILKKVNSEGINSLTDSERQFLLKAGEKLRRRRGGF